MLDFVPNHCSDEHDWFQKSILREEPYTDYFTWLDPAGVNASGDPIPPNNWVGKIFTLIKEQRNTLFTINSNFNLLHRIILFLLKVFASFFKKIKRLHSK